MPLLTPQKSEIGDMARIAKVRFLGTKTDLQSTREILACHIHPFSDFYPEI